MSQARWLGALRVPGSRAPSFRAFAPSSLAELARLVPRVVAALAGSYAIVALAYVSFKRIRYPYDLEWMEGGSLVHVERVLHGAPLYTSPSLDWTPFIYTPLYWYVSAGFAKVMGLTLFAPRLVSLLSTGVSLLAIYASVRRDGSRFAAFLAASLFAATFRLSGAWFDLARPDMLACALGCTAIWLLGEHSPSMVRLAVAGLCLVGSVLSKQTWLVAACAVVTACALESGRRTWVLISCFVLPLVGIGVMAHWSSGGWSTYYTLRLPFEHDVVTDAFQTFVVYDLAKNHGPVICLAVAAFVLLPRDRRRFFAIVTLGGLGSAVSARVHSGAYDNVLIPGYAVLSMLAGHAVAAIDRKRKETGKDDALGLVALTAVVVQVASLHYDPSTELSNRRDRGAGKRVVETLKAQSGDVWVPFHGAFCLAANKPCHAHWMAMSDVLRGSQKEPRKVLLASMKKTLSSGRITAIVADDTFPGSCAELAPLVDKYYPKKSPLVEAGPAPKTGYITKPVELRTR